MRTPADDSLSLRPRSIARLALVAVVSLAVLATGCRARHAETPDAEAAPGAESPGSGEGAVEATATPSSPPEFAVAPASWSIDDHLPPGDVPAVTWAPTAAEVPGLMTARAATLDADGLEAAQRDCEGGDGAACRSAAAGAVDGTTEGIEAALALLQLGCAQRDDTACAWLVAMLDRGGAGGQLPARLGPACTRDVHMACAGLGWAAAGRVEGARASEPQAEALLIRACDAGEGLACGLLGVVLDDERTIPLFERGCDEGSGASCQALGAALERAADRSGAREAFAAGCAAGDRTSCRLQGVFALDAADGVLDDEAIAGLESACEGEDAAACGLLADRLVDRDGPEDGLEAATPWFVTACNLGDGPSCHRFAQWIGDDAPEELRADLRRRACEGGVAADCEAASP